MGYENFKNRDLRAMKIATNAQKFGIEALQNEALVNQFLNSKKFEINGDEQGNIREIFEKLMQVEQDVQLSK